MSFNTSQFKGIHKVTKAPERVWVGRWWSIEVPVGFSYTVDPEKAGGGGMGTYQLHIQNSKDCNFDVSYSSEFNVVVYGNMEGINRNCDDMSDEAMLQSLDELPTHFLGHYQIHKCSRDLVVLYKVMEESKEYTAYEFQVITRGCNLVFTGQFNLQTGTISERKKNILLWLDTVEVLTQDERLSFTDYSGKSKSKIPTEYGKAMATIDTGIKISIPRGFHAETNQAIIGEPRKLVIVPESYSLSADPMEAPVALSIQSSVMKNVPTRADLLNTYFEFFCDRGVPFEKNSVIGMYKNSDKAFTVSQFFTGDYFSKAFSLLFANNNVYIVHLIINYSARDFDARLATWDVDHLAKAWLARIHVTGETIPNYPSRSSSSSVKKSLPTVAKATPSLDLYPHYDQLGNTSVPKTDLGGMAVIVTNAGGTEFESYPFSHFDGELKAVAERAISKDSCSKEFKQLVATATTYAALFRVNKDKFNPKEDRECDIRNLRMRRAYQLHVLRSFAWTLAEQASLQQKSLSDLVIEEYQKVFTAIEKREYLNYQGESHFPTLCGTADLHVFFVPDKTTKADKKTLNDSGEVFGNIIPNSVGSLDGLRKDLLALAETMEKLFQWLLSTRDYSKPLRGPGADTLYAWCTLVLSAETPFYIEDGPMTCRYTQIADPPVPTKEKAISKKKTSGKMYTLEGDRLISYKGKAFTPIIPDGVGIIGTGAFSDNNELGCIEIPKSITTIQTNAFRNCPNLFRILIPDIPLKIEKDAFVDCPTLYIDTLPNSAAEKYCKANGIPCKTDALCAKLATEAGKKQDKATKKSAEDTSAEIASNNDKTKSKKLPGRKFYEVDDDLRLIRYKGNAYDKLSLNLPNDVVVIGSGAIVDDDQVCFVSIPKSVTLIETGAFQNLPKLLCVIVPDTDIKIEKGAFINCPRFRIDTFSGSPAEKQCKRNGIPCKTDDMCKVYFPEITRKREKAKAKEEAEAKAKAEAEQKRIDEENRLKRIAASLQQKLMMAYHDNLDASRLDDLTRGISADVACVCDKQTWTELCRRRITVLTTALLKDTVAKVSSAPSPEEAYDMLPKWAAAEYISIAEEKRARMTFERIIRDVDALSKKPVLADFENGVEKNEILRQIISNVKAAIKDNALLEAGLIKYDSNAALGTLRSTLGRRPFDSTASLIDAIVEKKSAEFDRLTALLEKKTADIEAIQKEAAKLEEERSHLGFFQGKRKKEIAALLEQIPARIKQVEEDYDKAKMLI